MYFFVNVANAAAAHLIGEIAFDKGYQSGYNQALIDVYERADALERRKQGSIVTSGGQLSPGQLILPGSKDW